jgi:hypothetical protein
MKLLDRVASALATAKAGLDLIGSDGEPTAVVNGLRQHLLALEEELLNTKQMAQALQKEALDLREKLADAERFDGERDRYVLTRLGSGAAVYTLKEHMRLPEGPLFYFCTHCFERRERSILQFAERKLHFDTYTCRACDGAVQVPNDAKAEAFFFSTGPGFDGY